MSEVRRRTVFVTLSVAVLASLSGCTTTGTISGCDDTVVRSADLPLSMTQAGMDEAFGTGDLFFVTPKTPRWGDLLEARGSPTEGKFAMWVDSPSLPSVAVELQGGASPLRGSADLAPTTDGLPGPVPMNVRIPSSGCWRIFSKSSRSEISILVNNAN